MSEEAATTQFECWAVIELFGHKKIAGFVTEATIGGASLIRCDIPNSDGSISHTRYLGPSAIYSLNPVKKEVAIRLAQFYADRPVAEYELPALPAPGGSATIDLEPDGEDWDDDADNDEEGLP